MIIGQKAKLLTALDSDQADAVSLRPTYSIEISFERSPQKQVKCGAIVVFRLNTMESLNANIEKVMKAQPGPELQKVLNEAAERAAQQTESMHMDPIYFKEPDGQWIAWAIDRSLRLYDQFNGDARIIIKSARLRVREERSSHEIATLRNEPLSLFRMAWHIDRMLEAGFSWDPWTQTTRRGPIGVHMGKR